MIVESEIQHITYNEYLPLLLGYNAIQEYNGYNSKLSPQILNEFSCAAYRLGHSLVNHEVLRLDENRTPISAGNLTLKETFFQSYRIRDEGGIEPVLRGASESFSEEIDHLIINDLRNFLFGNPGSGGMDIVCLNIQRGRDHGLCTLNDARRALRLEPYGSFDELTSDDVLIGKLNRLYKTPNNVDLWVGGLIEEHYKNSMIGETFYHIILNQFNRTRDCDPYWYEKRLDKKLLSFVKSQTLASIIKRNTDITQLHDNCMVHL